MRWLKLDCIFVLKCWILRKCDDGKRAKVDVNGME